MATREARDRARQRAFRKNYGFSLRTYYKYQQQGMSAALAMETGQKLSRGEYRKAERPEDLWSVLRRWRRCAVRENVVA
jgi:hypothetical protein